ncbi:MAG: phosphotransferase family protein [Lachnospiraceae bacterium]
MKLTNLIAEGKVADVYEQDGKAIKVFHDPHSKTKALREALTHARVEELGFNMPKIEAIEVIDGKWAIVMELIEGKNLEQLMEENPEKKDEYIEMMVSIMNDIHKVQVPLFHEYRNRLRRQINEVASIDDVTRYDLLAHLDSVPKHIKLCHGSFEPKNIMIKDGKAYILNWVNATRGNASADAANTYLLLALTSIETADKFLKEFCEQSGISKRNVQAWIPIVAAARLTLGHPEERELLLKWSQIMECE